MTNKMPLILRKYGFFARHNGAALRNAIFKPFGHFNSNRRMLSTTLRNFSQDFQQEGLPGTNLPFGIGNKYFVTLGFAIFFGSAFNVPFILTRFVLWDADMGTGEYYEVAQETSQSTSRSQIVCFEEIIPDGNK